MNEHLNCVKEEYPPGLGRIQRRLTILAHNKFGGGGYGGFVDDV